MQRVVPDAVCAEHLCLEVGLVGLVHEFSPAELSLSLETLADDGRHEGGSPLVHWSERRDGVVLVVQDVLDDVVLASEARPVQVPRVRLQLCVFLDVFRIHCLQNGQLLLVFEQFLDLLSRDLLLDNCPQLVDHRLSLAHARELMLTSRTLIVIVDGEGELLAGTVEVAALGHLGPWRVLAGSSVSAL